MPELTSMINIGKEMASKLYSIDIISSEDLIKVGSKQAFFMLKSVYPQVCLVHLYALEGAIQGVPLNKLSKEQKEILKMYSSLFK